MTPGQAGLPPGGGDRRVPGLRREELALLVGISVDYLVRLEQGRATSPSAQVLSALARTLQLSVGERELLFRLGGLVAPPTGPVPRTVPRGVQLMIDRMQDTPVAVYTAAWDAVQWNDLFAELVGDPGKLTGRARNLAWLHFATSVRSRIVREPGETHAFEQALVADLRRAVERYPDDRAMAELIAALRQENPHFADLWSRYDAGPAAAASKTIFHPEHGPITVACDLLTIDGSDLRILLYSTVPGSRDAELLERVRASALDRTARRHAGSSSDHVGGR